MEIRNPVGTEATPLQFHKSHPLTETHKYTVRYILKYGTVECFVFGNYVASLQLHTPATPSTGSIKSCCPIPPFGSKSKKSISLNRGNGKLPLWELMYKMYILYLPAEDNTFALELRGFLWIYSQLWGGIGRWWGDSMDSLDIKTPKQKLTCKGTCGRCLLEFID
jgi:hypothetical protein